ncbi:MAG: peptide-methionine (S)-S-oxide reductase MsrA [Lactovum sp.]
MTKECAIFAGGCFWCMVEPFEEKKGVLTVTSGYTGGDFNSPTYEQVCQHITGHTEAVEIIFDNEEISYEELLELYWQSTDPTDALGQFVDRGDNYRPVIFYQSENQHLIAENSKVNLEKSGIFERPIVTSIEKATKFWPAEEKHQAFYKKHPKEYSEEIAERRRFLMEHWHDVL